MDKRKLIVKETGGLVNIKNEFQIKHMSFSFEFPKGHPSDLGDVVKDNIEKAFVHSGTGEIFIGNELLNHTRDREGTYYTCDNGETYHESEVVVGLDEIREYKLKNNLDL
jgi:hypothetical protein